jgi:hypothetical protein
MAYYISKDEANLMDIRGKSFREYMQLLNLIIYWDIIDYNERIKGNESKGIV